MSRPSGNKFADFFPTAPSVLQQRKASRTVLQKTRAEVREDPSEDAPSEKFSARSSASGEESHLLRQPAQIENIKPECVAMNQDESEHFTGDLLNGVGSASSTSTASSVFSSANLNSAMALSNGIHLHAMTPLTNADSSPPPKMISPIH
jgi:[histone H3]-lysine4 N-trimethyltransferase SETD1